MTLGQAYFLTLIGSWILVNSGLIVALFKRGSKTKKPSEGLLVRSVVIALASTVALLVLMGTYRLNIADIFHKYQPICVEKVKTFPLESHWTNPMHPYFVLDESINNHLVENCEYDTDKRFNPGDAMDALGMFVKQTGKIQFHPDSLNNDVIVMYKYHYKKWNGFECPSVVQKVTFSVGEWEPFKRGICKSEIELK